ncbi:hypothetical protein [Streptomyces sp. LaBMicrA B280]|uniref:hypothetical protein n=1 Tax=Streptomyces sp. LaBMicrA B280 TaxID=3391001 RepID=UPI003BA6D5F9
MSGLVVVRLLSPGGEAAGAAHRVGPVLRVRMGATGSGAEMIAEAGHVRLGAHELPEADEHCAVNAEAAPENRRLACADVLYGVRPRPPASAVHWLTGMTARHPSCALAAVPLSGGGWLALAGAAGSNVKWGAVALVVEVAGRGSWRRRSAPISRCWRPVCTRGWSGAVRSPSWRMYDRCGRSPRMAVRPRGRALTPGGARRRGW